jgi:hypothetical protein
MTLVVQNDEMLEREAEHFHACFFREALHRDVVKRYVAANRACIPFVDAETVSSIEKILSYGLDVDAVEYGLRLKNRENALTKKIQILFFLIEVRSKYFDCFFNRKTERLRAVAGMFSAVMLTAYKFIKGRYLVRRYGLV